MKKIIMTICMLVFCVVIFAQKGSSALLSDLLERTGGVMTYKELPLVLEKDSNGVCTHYGVRLFSKELKESVRKDYPMEYLVYTFLERYALEMVLEEDETSLLYKLKDDKVVLLDGGVSSLKRIAGKDCDFDYQPNDNYCEVAWRLGGRTVLRIAFPIHYALLCGRNKIEQELAFMSNVLCADASLKKDDIELLPILSECAAPNSASQLDKLLQGQLDIDVTLQMVQSLYSSKESQTREFQLPLDQWLRYCQQEEIRLSMGIEKEDEYYYEVLLIAENQHLKYNHILSLLVPKGFATQSELRIRTKVNAYVPTHNLKNLYQESAPKSTSKKSKHIHL